MCSVEYMTLWGTLPTFKWFKSHLWGSNIYIGQLRLQMTNIVSIAEEFNRAFSSRAMVIGVPNIAKGKDKIWSCASCLGPNGKTHLTGATTDGKVKLVSVYEKSYCNKI